MIELSYDIPRRLNRTERRLMKKRGEVAPKAMRNGLPELPPPPADPYALTEEERAKVVPHLRKCLAAGVDIEGNPLGPRERERMVSTIEFHERNARDVKKTRALLDRSKD